MGRERGIVFSIFGIMVLISILIISIPEAEAGNGGIDDCIINKNSEVCLDSDSDNITNSWDTGVGGTRIGHLDGQELFICELSAGKCNGVPTNISDFDTIGGSFAGEGKFTGTFTDTDFQEIRIEITWEIIGGLLGSSESTLKETIKIIRTGEGTTNRFFQETDFDLGGGSTDTFVQISSNSARQEDSDPDSGPPIIGSVLVSPPANKIMADVHDEVVDAILDKGELDNTTGPITGEADYVFGFSWDFRLTSTDNSFTIEKIKRLAPSPEPGTIFGAEHSGPDGPSTLYTIDRSTGAATSVGLIKGFERCSGIDFHPVTLILYGTCERSEDSDQLVLVTISTLTGAGTEVGPFTHTFHEGGGSPTVTDISFRNSDNTLYAYLERGDGLGTINAVTGALTEKGLTGVTCCGNGIAFSPGDTLFHANQASLSTLDQTSGSATFVASIDYPDFGVERDTRINGMDFDPSSGQLFVSINVGGKGSPNFFGTLSTNPGELGVIGETVAGLDAIAVFPSLVGGPTTPAGGHEPPTIGKNLRGNYQIITNGICIDAQCWTVTENFHVDFELVEMLTSPHTISNTIYCSKGVDTCNHITLSASPYQEFFNAEIWKVSMDKNFLGELTVTKDDPDSYLGDTTCTAQIIEEKYWGTSCTIDFLKPMPGVMLGVQVWDDYGGVRNFYFNDGIEIIDTYGYPSVDTEFESSLDVPRLCLSDDPDKRTSCAFAEKVQLEIERAERLLTG